MVMTWHQQAQYSIRHDDSARHIEAFQGVRQGCSVAPTLWLMNSSNTCYINAAVVAWLHITNRLNCNDRQAYGSRMQAWRDIMQSLRPLHVHTLASWRNILAGWRDLHRQQDATEFLEYWVAVGRPQAVVGTWEARIEISNSLRLGIIHPLMLL